MPSPFTVAPGSIGEGSLARERDRGCTADGRLLGCRATGSNSAGGWLDGWRRDGGCSAEGWLPECGAKNVSAAEETNAAGDRKRMWPTLDRNSIYEFVKALGKVSSSLKFSSSRSGVLVAHPRQRGAAAPDPCSAMMW